VKNLTASKLQLLLRPWLAAAKNGQQVKHILRGQAISCPADYIPALLPV
jgi:hypothetical protein